VAKNKFRFGALIDGGLAPTFSIESRKGETYLFCRELGGVKHSFHKSGIHRFAENNSGPRLPIEGTNLLSLVDGQFWTVARIIISGRYQINKSEPDISGIHLADIGVNDAVVYSIGFLPHHPDENEGTKSDHHIWIYKIEDNKYLVLTKQIFSCMEICQNIFLHYPPSPDSTIKQEKILKEGGLSYLLHYRSAANTYTYWINYVGNNDKVSVGWPERIYRAIQIALAVEAKSGSVARKTDQHLSRVVPDWREQISKIRERGV